MWTFPVDLFVAGYIVLSNKKLPCKYFDSLITYIYWI